MSIHVIPLRLFCLLQVMLFSMAPWASPALAAVTHHDLQVKIVPSQSLIEVSDVVTLPADGPLQFVLNAAFIVEAEGAELERSGQLENGRLALYKLNRLDDPKKVQLRYRGKIKTLAASGPFAMPDAILSEQAMYLDGNSAWVPRFISSELQSFTLTVEAPRDWQVISQGKRGGEQGRFRFDMPVPQDDIYLLGGSYERYAKQHGDIELEVYLLEAEPSLALRYLDATASYMDLYSEWIGDYPYGKFAIVENRWQTGYGMPSFTLLGSRVIRLPFILYTSLPHEILHNWWGNGVFIDTAEGNWSEGLTAYMADHHSNEQRGKAAEYRRKTLERYANYASEGRDMALQNFVARHGDASQAVGYGKSLMLFHMLRKARGDDGFSQALQAFWRDHRFDRASFSELLRYLVEEPEERAAFIQQWLLQPGAPELSLGEVSVERADARYRLSLAIEQLQDRQSYRFSIPLRVEFDDGSSTTELLDIGQRIHRQQLDYARAPVRLRLDPDYDVFRLLDAAERPASLGRLYGAGRQILVIPEAASEAEKRAWQQLASSWQQRYDNIDLRYDNDIDDLPADAAVWLLGWDNRLLQKLEPRFETVNQSLAGNSVTIDGKVYNKQQHAVILLDADNTRTPLGFIGATSDTIGSLARKLTHYGSFGRLVFDNDDVSNLVKQTLPVLHSPLERQLALQ